MSLQVPNSVKADTHSIYLNLDLRPKIDEYHWAFWLVDEDRDDGLLIHANNLTGAWVIETKIYNAYCSVKLAASIKIGSFTPEFTYQYVSDMLGTLNPEVAEDSPDALVRFTCRIWIREAIRLMHSHNIISCPDVDALEREAIEFASLNRSFVESGECPARFFYSTTSA